MYVAEYCGKDRIEKLRDEAKQERLIRTLAQKQPKFALVFKVKVFLKRRVDGRLSKI